MLVATHLLGGFFPGIAGPDDRRAVQSVGIHLMTLALFLEHGVDPARGSFTPKALKKPKRGKRR